MRLLPRRRSVICQELTELVTDYLEGALEPGLVRAIERHLAGCPHCTEYVAQVRRSIEITRRTGARTGDEPDLVVPPELLDALRRAVEEHQRSEDP